MTRIYARVRRDFGPDAIIVQTRSLLREGADPLIEVLAAPGGDGYGLPLDLQQAMVDGSLARVEGVERQLTVGDLEDLVERERGARRAHAAAATATATVPVPAASLHPAAERLVPPLPTEGRSDQEAFAVPPLLPVEDVADPLPLPHPRAFPSLPEVSPEA